MINLMVSLNSNLYAYLLLTNCFYKQINMMIVSQEWMFFSLTILVLLLLLSTSLSSAATRKTNKNIKTNVFMSPKIELTPGLVSNKVYYDVEFPRGHISLKSFNAELVDEAGILYLFIKLIYTTGLLLDTTNLKM
jgi:hypothetical protein